MLKRAVSIVAILVALFVVGGFLLPSDYALARSVVIDAQAEKIHAFVDDLRTWERWSPWKSSDPPIRARLGEHTRGVGASQTWTSNSGSGAMRITHSDPRTGVEFEFVLDDEHTGRGAVMYASEGGRTKVTWQLEGEMRGLSGPYFAMCMEKLVGPRFSDSLRRLKAAAETR